MQPGQPSLTALGAARLRAAHQVLDNASILADPLALAGYRYVEDIGPGVIAARFFPEPERSAPPRGGHVMHASTI